MRFRNAAPVFHAGHFYTSAQSNIYKIDARTGKIKLMTETDYHLNVSSSPAIKDDLIIIGSTDAGVIAFDLHNFEEVWRFKTQVGLTVSAPYRIPPRSNIAASPVITNNQVFIGGLDGNFYCLNARTGLELWSVELGAPIYSSVAITEDAVYVSDLGGNVYSFSDL